MPEITRITTQDLRTTIPQFEKLSDEDLAPCVQHGEARHFGDGETLFFEGQPARALYFLVRGRVRIHRKLPTGAQLDLVTLEQGAIFGEVALLAETERTASASAQGAVLVLRVPGERLYPDYREGKLYAQTLMIAVARLLAGRLEAMNRRLTDMISLQSRGGELDSFRKKMFQDWTV